MYAKLKKMLMVGAVLISSPALAQQYPNKPITMIIPFSPGASNDIFGRYLADGLSKLWKQTVVVENRAGAGGSIGAVAVVKSRADGYTIMFSSSSYTINSAVQKPLPFDPIKDIKPVAMAMRGQMIAVTGNRIPLPNLAEVVKQAKSQKVFYGANGASSTTFAAELFANVAGVKLEGVNYKGGTESMVDMIGGRLDIYFGTVTTVLPSVLNKSVTAVAVTSLTRSPALPDVPTVAEAGFPGAETDIWWGVFVPAGTPADVMAKINEGVNTVVGTPEAKDFLEKQAALPARSTVDDFTKTVVTELAKWKELAEKHNITAD
ncbi:MAG: tripartite tricarboxylate transporter substrate binding protein [Alphaproteobacteria bacterium]|nr:tripartite tricarboxylate transporter substrate binding protein [Alphaproteobacteria bacterium]